MGLGTETPMQEFIRQLDAAIAADPNTALPWIRALAQSIQRQTGADVAVVWPPIQQAAQPTGSPKQPGTPVIDQGRQLTFPRDDAQQQQPPKS